MCSRKSGAVQELPLPAMTEVGEGAYAYRLSAGTLYLRVDDGATVAAACYDGSGRMTSCAVFGAGLHSLPVSGSIKFFSVSSAFAPLCPAVTPQ